LFENTGLEGRQGFQDGRVYDPRSGMLNGPYSWTGEAAAKKAATHQTAQLLY
jgi:hypothetical protein